VRGRHAAVRTTTRISPADGEWDFLQGGTEGGESE